MPRYSPQISDFLKQVGLTASKDVVITPRSDSAGGPGDFVFFRYKLGIGVGSRAERLFLLLEPITRDAATGNLLLTGIKVPLPGDYGPDSLYDLYNNKELPRDNYRTYIMTNIYGPLRKLIKPPKKQKLE
jgi:hypothetical protein